MSAIPSPSRRNFIFYAVGPGPGLHLPEAGETYDRGAVLWHPNSPVQEPAHEGELVAWRDFDRTKRKFVCFAEAYRAGKIPRDRDAYAIPDDDIELPPGLTWDAIFAAFHETSLVIAQPALTKDSTRAWPVTQVNERCRHRETDFVEVMVPIVRGSIVGGMIDYFTEERNGWGLEGLWSGRYRPIGILDSVPVRHTRPLCSAGNTVGLGGYDACEKRAAEFRAKHGLPFPKGVVLRGFAARGKAKSA